MTDEAIYECGRLMHLTDSASIRQPLYDPRWWAAFVLFVAVAFAGGWALFQLGLDSGAAGMIASAPLLMFATVTLVWRKRALSSAQRPPST